ncbi:MAG: hypothetical protein MUC44_14920 [Beijerinckiaceae bacterium]|jgi:hypothetical protein|nr:hypothetical protein [Beijerinckiaceae bacterium]
MNRIVREHFPVERLPEELRVGLDPGAVATITVILEEQPMVVGELLKDLLNDPHRPRRDKLEIDDHIRELRED